jgi:single-strand DNA-binding protein
MFNKVVIVGNLTRDIEMKFTPGGLGIANTAIAATKKFKAQDGSQKEEVMFIDIAFFGRTAEVVQQYLRKGSKVLIEGRLKFDQWSDQNGQKRSKHSVSVETMQMLDSKGSNPSAQDKQYQQTNNQSTSTTPAPVDDKGKPFSNEIENDDMPF